MAKRKEINWDVVDALATNKSSERYIAEYLLKKEGHLLNKTMVDTMVKRIEHRIKERWNVTFIQFREQKQEAWKVELTQLQRTSARNGSIPMQIFLGKQDLDQCDKTQLSLEKLPNQVFIDEANRRLALDGPASS